MELLNKDALISRFKDECRGHCLDCPYYSHMVNGTCGLIKGESTVDNVVILPEKEAITTNGDVIEELFPNYKFERSCGWVHVNFDGENYAFCPDKFWNARFKGEKE